MDLLDRDTFFVGGEGQPLPTRVSAILPTFEVTVTVNRGINLPHRPTETKRHPTYECILEVHTGNGQCSLFKPHVVERFFDQYRRLHQALQTIGIGHQKHHTSIYIEAPFPCTYFLSQFGFRLSEDLLIRRSKMLHNWIQALFQNYASLPIAAWVLISHFLSSQDEQQDANKDNMLALLRRTTISEMQPSETVVFKDHFLPLT